MNSGPGSLLGVLLLGLALAGAARGAPTAEGEAERMLAALGGRAAWAAVTNTVNDSQQNRATGEFPVVRAVVTIDFLRPRVRVKTRGPNLDLVRVIDGEKHWRRTRDGRIAPIPEDILTEDRLWYAGHVYRTIHRIAARDPVIALGLGQGGRLEVTERGTRIAWFKLDARGEPYNFGAHGNDVGTLCGPWEFERAGIRHPVWVSSPDGTWRANLKALEVNVPLEDALFSQPGR